MRKRRAKIVATLGPTSHTVEKISELIEAGLDVARINMSHSTHANHATVIANIRRAGAELGRHVAILLDLQGPKIRVDKLAQPLQLEVGAIYRLGTSATLKKYGFDPVKDQFIPTTYERIVEDTKVGESVLFNDGIFEAKVVEVEQDFAKIEIVQGGELTSNKGINLPDSQIKAPSMTAKDHEDLLFGLQQGVDYVALSFVRTVEDILQVKYLLHRLKTDTPVVAKIERPEAVTNIEAIIGVTDCIMIARGDMGVEVGNHLVPPIQKKIIQLCNAKGVPVITATQMLESMITNPRPTRAEASDVANAIWDGTDALMLSGETANGAFPVLAVKMMDKIVVEAEQIPRERPLLRNIELNDVCSSVQVAASLIAEKISAKYIVAFTESGSSGLKLSRFRPKTPVLGTTTSTRAARRMCLYWGIRPYYLDIDLEEEDTNKIEILGSEMLKAMGEEKMVSNGDKVVLTYGDGRFFTNGISDSIKVEIVKDLLSVGKKSDAVLEGATEDFKILLDTNLCASCRRCVEVCPYDIYGVDSNQDHATFIDTSRVSQCTLDMECVEACPAGAIEIIS